MLPRVHSETIHISFRRTIYATAIDKYLISAQYPQSCAYFNHDVSEDISSSSGETYLLGPLDAANPQLWTLNIIMDTV
jgi:hypothetical protein